MSLLHKYRKEKLLEKRLSRLERVIVERSIGKNNEPSKAYRIWDYLMNNGPTSVADLKRVLPDDITRAINFFAKNDLLVKNGDMVSANADYAWDDVGVIPRTAEQEVLNDIGNKLNSTSTDSSDSPTPTRRRAVKANLFSRKIEEVKAAIDAGQDVNQINDKGQTPLLYACGSKTDTGPIVELLLENGADPTITINGDRNQCISLAIKNKNISVIKALALGGVALYSIYKNTDCYLCALIDYLDEATFSKVLDKHFSSSTRLYMYILHSIITAAFRKYGTDTQGVFYGSGTNVNVVFDRINFSGFRSRIFLLLRFSFFIFFFKSNLARALILWSISEPVVLNLRLFPIRLSIRK